MGSWIACGTRLKCRSRRRGWTRTSLPRGPRPEGGKREGGGNTSGEGTTNAATTQRDGVAVGADTIGMRIVHPAVQAMRRTETHTHRMTGTETGLWESIPVSNEDRRQSTPWIYHTPVEAEAEVGKFRRRRSGGADIVRTRVANRSVRVREPSLLQDFCTFVQYCYLPVKAHDGLHSAGCAACQGLLQHRLKLSRSPD